MIIKPSIRGPLILNAHPKGCFKNVENQIKYIQNNPNYQTNKPKNVLILGGSAGYGLASKISLLFGAKANVISVAFETAPTVKKTGTAGFWNNLYVDYQAKNNNLISSSLNLDCFLNASKEAVHAEMERLNIKQFDLIIYSIAAPRRLDEETNTLYTSTLKPLGKKVTGQTINFGNDTLEELSIEPANEEEKEATIQVMGGKDWSLWINYLIKNNLVSENFKTINLSYIGSKATEEIYKNGTIGAAKKDLEKTCKQINDDIGKQAAYVAVNKAIISRASSVIPYLGLYVGALFKVMREENLHETIIEHQHRLLSKMLYGEEPIFDANNNLRPDNFELSKNIQAKTMAIMDSINDNWQTQIDYPYIKKDFLNINGFGFDDVNYDEEIDLLELVNQYLI